jgi:VIT1/CCC1 family predicted Fe2+/Mn2+ transporter
MARQEDFWKSRLRKWTAIDRQERITEALYGLIMVLTFTCTISVSTAGKKEVKDLLWAALGCNLAWGIVDGIMYLMGEIINRARSITQLNKIRETGSADASWEIVRNNISPLLSELMNDEEVSKLSEKMKQLPEPNIRISLTMKDLLIALQIFFIVFLSTFPVALPFLLLKDVAAAMRVSNGVALVLMFTSGFALARYSGLRPLVTAFAYAALGVFLVALTMMLGG